MAREPRSTHAGDTENSGATSSETPLAGTETAPNPANGQGASASTAGDERFVMVKRSDGTRVKRVDYIEERLKAGASRGAVAKELTEMNTVANGGDGKKVPYQVVFPIYKKLKAKGLIPASTTPSATEPQPSAST